MSKAKDLRQVRDIAEKRLIEGDALGALKVFRLVLNDAPLDFRTRLRIGDSLLVLGEPRLAVSVYLGVAVYCSKAGLPLRALVAVKMIAQSYPQVKSLMKDIATLYGKDSPVIGRGARAAPVDLSATVRSDVDLDYDIAEKKLKSSAARRAADINDITQYPRKLPPIPPLSELSSDALLRVIDVLELRRLDKGDVVVKEGARRDAMFIVARGSLKSSSSNGSKAKELGEGSIFGEVTLLSSGPWSSSVVVEESADLLVLDRDKFADIAGEHPEIAEVLLGFAKKRMIRNAMDSDTLFSPFDGEERVALFKRLDMHTVKAGTVFLHEGEDGQGLYIILAGAVDVLTSDRDGEERLLATLGPDACFGEISSLNDCPTTATVRASEETTVLFLAKVYFRRLIETYPKLASHYAKLGTKRLLEMKSVLTRMSASAERDTSIDRQRR